MVKKYYRKCGLLIFVIAAVLAQSVIMPGLAAQADTDPRLERFNTLAETGYVYQDPMTREEFCVAIAKLFNEGRLSEIAPPFEDIDDIKPENKELLAALYEDGLLKGSGAGDKIYMLPGDFITRQEAVTFLGRVLGRTSESTLTFTDEEDIALYAYEYIAWFADWGIILGHTDGSFAPRSVISAGELASLTTRTLDHLKTAETQIETIAGTGAQGHADGDRRHARFTLPYGVLANSDGTVTVFDTYNNTVRTISRGDRVTQTLAGRVEYYDDYGFPQGFYSDDDLDDALLSRPADGARDPAGNLYIADSANHVIRFIRGGALYTFSGTAEAGYADGARDIAQFNMPMAIASDKNGNFYVADTLNNCIRKIDPNGNVTTVAGVPETGGYLDGEAGEALFNEPAGIAVNNDGSVIFVADTGNHLIRKIDIDAGLVTTLAGMMTGEADDDGEPLGGFKNGVAGSAVFNLPRGLALAESAADGKIVLFVADSGNHMIRAVTPGGIVITVVGSGEAGDRGGSCMDDALNAACGVSVSGGVLYIADTGNNKIKSMSVDIDLYMN